MFTGFVSSTARLLTLLCALALVAFVSIAPAHAEDEDIKASGLVSAKSTKSISITTTDKKNPLLVFEINDKTQVDRDRSQISIEAVEVGEMAGVIGIKREGQLIAIRVATRGKR